MKVVILTGAGISQESGIPTFRDSNGLWEGHDIKEVATKEAILNNPTLVNKFYNQRRKDLNKVEPNKAHIALANLEHLLQNDFLLITQNVDDLHERAGSKRIIHMHGELTKQMCMDCLDPIPCHKTNKINQNDTCPQCHEKGVMRPDIVFFGEEPKELDKIDKAIEQADIFISIGTSGNVYPASGYVQHV
jgi:NAD-dependent deacetylase